MDENDLKDIFLSTLSGDFHIKPECHGIAAIDSSISVYLDFLCFPKRHVIDAGFNRCYFGVEVKYIENASDNNSKFCRLFHQAITYQQSFFEVRGGKTRPQFTLIFTNAHSPDIGLKNIEFYRRYLQIANFSSVGDLVINDPDYDMRFSGGVKYSMENTILSVSPHKMGEGVYFGNSAKKRSQG